MPTNTPNAPALGQTAARGFSWLLGQTVGTKIINLGVQVLLAWLLVPQDFGLIGLAYTVVSFISTLQQAGLSQILIHRQKHFHRWANPVFWLSVCLGIAAMALILAAIPLATRLYEEPKLAGLLMIMSLNAPLGSLAIVPQAKLANALRFKASASVSFAAAVGNAATACLLAWWGWGAYAIAVGLVAGMATRVALLWTLAPHRPRLHIQVRRWRFMVGDSTAILMTGILQTVVMQGDYIALGVCTTAAVTGVYYFAYNLSTQTFTLFLSNLMGVLFPTLAKLQHEPQRQMEAFIRVSRLLAVMAIPLCLLQAALAGPVIRLVFDPRWEPAIPVLQILSVGMAIRLVAGPATSMIQSQGRFRTDLKVMLIMAFICMLAVWPVAALGGGAIGVAIAISGWSILYGPILIAVAIKNHAKITSALFNIYAPPVLGSVIAIGGSLTVTSFVSSPSPMGQLFKIGIVLIFSIFIYVPLLKWWASDMWDEISRRVRGLLKRKVNSDAA